VWILDTFPDLQNARAARPEALTVLAISGMLLVLYVPWKPKTKSLATLHRSVVAIARDALRGSIGKGA